MLFKSMMCISIILNIGSVFTGNIAFNTWGVMFYIVGCQCLYMNNKYVVNSTGVYHE